ncbi:DUF2339 domain-containing protein [Tsukamurella strandjordii]|uniref:DUF2339 domain-containing protein n=1 Tax=Tsukamurella strandjordii TaxID=147577 RepID=UPI0031CDCFA4
MTATDSRIARLATELDITVRRLQWMQVELGEIARDPRGTVAPVPAQVPARPLPAPLPAPRPVPPARPNTGVSGPVWTPGPGSAPAPAATPSAASPFTVGRVLAGAGVLVTLVGVALLLVLAAQAGLLGPAVRVGLGTALAAGLLGTALWLHRRPGGTVGASALAATGVAAAYLDTVAITGIYHWVNPAVGLALSGLIALGGLWLASRWNSQWLGIAVFAPIYPLAPPLADSGYLLGGFTVILAIASIGVRRPADWQWLHLVRSVGTSGTLAVLALAADSAEALPALGAAVLGATVGLLAAADPRARDGRALPLVAGGMIAALPVLVALPGAPAWAAAGGVAALIAGAVAMGLLPGTVTGVRAAWFGTATVAALLGTAVLVPPVWIPAALLGAGTAALSAGARDRVAMTCGCILGGIGILLGVGTFGATVLATSSETVRYAGSAGVLVASALGIAFGAVLVWRGSGAVPAERRTAILIAGGAIILGSTTVLLVNAGWAVAGPAGMRWGHGLATVTWMAVGAAAVLVRRPGTGPATTVAGLVMIGAAVAKLFLFDLASLDGVVRVIAFLVVGVALLAVGAVYAARPDRADDAPR